MKTLTLEGQQKIHEIAIRYRLSDQAVMSMLYSVMNGGGSMAQFNIPELGGNGQWMQGGMTMVGDMFNYSLQGTVSNLCHELSQLLYAPNVFELPVANINNQGQNYGSWWPSEFGSPSSSGGQNNMRYAYFPSPVDRLVVEQNNALTIYDTLNYYISGVSQQQNGSGYYTLIFSSQRGNLDVSCLPIINPNQTNYYSESIVVVPQPIVEQATWVGVPQVMETMDNKMEQEVMQTSSNATQEDIINKIERLADLLTRGILTEDEFSDKKKDLLSRL